MLRPERMRELTLLVRTQDAPRLIERLADERIVHLIDHKRQRIGHSEIDIGSPLPGAEELAAALVKTRSLLAKIPERTGTLAQPHTMQERIARLNEIAARCSQHESDSARLSAQLRTLEQKEELLALLPDTVTPRSLAARSITTYLVRRRKDTEAALRRTPAVLVKEGPGTVLVTVLRKDAQRAAQALAGHEQIDLAPLHGIDPATLREEIAIVRRQLDRERTMLEEFAEHRAFLEETERELALAVLKAQAPLHFGATRKATLITGFVPEHRIPDLERVLDGIPAVLETREAHDAPTALRNPRPLRDFEALIDLYTLPKYHEIDPTSIMAFAFPLFFGFMLGDIGYGLALLALFLWIRHAVPRARKFANIVIISAISSIIFGAVYGEAFGLEELFGFHLTPLLHRTEDLGVMFGIALLVGAIHVNIGLIFGIINRAHEGWFFALLEKGSWIALQAGALLVASAFGLLDGIPVLQHIAVNPAVAWTVLLMAVAGIAASEKLQGVLELPMIFSHILSYTRLVAIGLASVYMALVVNQLGGDLFAKGGAWIAAAVLLVIVGHTVNLALGLLGPFLHSLRLHYAEFFMKFYEGGGRQYRPFGTVDA